jgi:biotin synthase-like enzyme
LLAPCSPTARGRRRCSIRSISRTIAVARITMPKSVVRLSAGRET